MQDTINWEEQVSANYRDRIIVDPDNPILASKANRDRYTNLPSQAKYQGLPYLGSHHSEDALTWNVFRTLQETKSLTVISDVLGIGQPRDLLLWTLAPEIDDINAELQHATGSLIRKFDGIFRGQMTEPDVILLGTTGVAVIECKLAEPEMAPSHLWEGSTKSVEKRLPIYKKELPELISKMVTNEAIAPVYQLVRMAFYSIKLGDHFQIEPVVVSLANEKNWTIEIRKLRISPSAIWDIFRNEILEKDCPRCESLSWQYIRELMYGTSLKTLQAYLSTHACL